MRDFARLAFFFASPRHFDFFTCETETSKCFQFELKQFLHCSSIKKSVLHSFLALKKSILRDRFVKKFETERHT